MPSRLGGWVGDNTRVGQSNWRSIDQFPVPCAHVDGETGTLIPCDHVTRARRAGGLHPCPMPLLGLLQPLYR